MTISVANAEDRTDVKIPRRLPYSIGRAEGKFETGDMIPKENETKQKFCSRGIHQGVKVCEKWKRVHADGSV